MARTLSEECPNSPCRGIESAGEAILSVVRTVSPQVRPSLVHRDLYLPNTLVAAGRFLCLLDLEHARSWDALADFVKLQMWVFEKFSGLELLSGLLYWKKTGQSEMLADYQRRLSDWLTQS
jgi:aminoglycoside phosphotransferase (APT) family kinase protein